MLPQTTAIENPVPKITPAINRGVDFLLLPRKIERKAKSAAGRLNMITVNRRILKYR